jgi:hypothetical protein
VIGVAPPPAGATTEVPLDPADTFAVTADGSRDASLLNEVPTVSRDDQGMERDVFGDPQA